MRSVRESKVRLNSTFKENRGREIPVPGFLYFPHREDRKPARRIT